MDRYIVGKGEDIWLADNYAKIMKTITTRDLQKLLNNQSDRIDKLQTQLEEKEKELLIERATNNRWYKREIKRRDEKIREQRQQLKSQPTEIVEKIKQLCCIEDKCKDGSFVLGVNEKDLDTILEDYQK